ncbi:MAG: phosphate acyltransferase PlsX [Gammaproteobacteria bacterium]
MTSVTIAIDVMGGDHGPSVTIPAALEVLKRHTNIKLVLVGQPDIIQQYLHQHGVKQLPATLQIHAATQVVGMDELPSSALKHKKDSSMRVAINLVKEEQAHACVSAGNTGALMATARFVLKTIPGVERPAIMTAFPTLKAGTIARVLDLGANVDSSPEHLLQFAVMGSVLATAVSNIAEPRVGLLNIGQEEIKGNEQVKEAAQLLAQHKGLNYIGYVEGNDIYSGNVDVVVCDGFVGNIALKSSEGIANLILSSLKRAFHKNIYTKLVGLLAIPVLKIVKKHIDPANYNGACLIGLRGIVIKSHGGANTIAFANAISEAVRQAQQNIPQLVHKQVEQLLQVPSVQE